MDRRRLVVAAMAVPVMLALGWVIVAGAVDGDGGAPPGQQYVDFEGIRFEVPDDYVVQDIIGRVDGELACPDDAPGFVFTDTMDRASYTGATCDPPGDQVVVRLVVNPDVMPGNARVLTSPGGVDYVRSDPSGLVFVDSEVWLFVDGPGYAEDEELTEAIAASAAPSPDDDLNTPTTAEPDTSTTDRLADELGCESTEVASTYNRAGYAPFLGRQAEAPVDCYANFEGFRILVFRDDEARGLAEGYYAESAWLVVGDRWAVTALSQEAAEWAQERIGGEALPPDRCCGPPTSDFLPGSQ